MQIISRLATRPALQLFVAFQLGFALTACKVGQVSDGSRLRSEEGVATPFKLELASAVLSHLQEKDLSFSDVKVSVSSEEIAVPEIESKESYEIGSIKFDIQAKATKGEEKDVACSGTKMIADEASTVIRCQFKPSSDQKTDPKENGKGDQKSPPATEKTAVEKACDSISVNEASFKKETGECVCDADTTKKSKDEHYITHALASECSYAAAIKNKKSSADKTTNPSAKSCQCIKEQNKCVKKVDGKITGSLTITFNTITNKQETCDSTGKGGLENLCNQPSLKCP